MESDNLNHDTNNNDSPEEQLSKLAIDKAEVRDIPIDKIQIGEFCRRSNYDNIDPLAKSIERNGLLQPAAVIEDEDSQYTLVFGSRRYEAHKQLGEKTMRCYVIKASAAKAAILSFAENSGTEKVNPVEQARKLRLMVDMFGYKEEEIAEEIWWKQNTVSEYIGILELGDDILKKVDTRSESPFRYTHAQALSKLMRTNRFNREIEVRQLWNKTIECELSTTELKALVHLFKDGSYDRLPDALRTHLLTMKNMTSEMAKLYLEPEKLVNGEGQIADCRRKIAENIEKKQLESYVVKAVKAGWPFERVKQQVSDLIDSQLNSIEDKQHESKSSRQKLLGDISNIQRRLKICSSEVSHVAKTNPAQLKWVRRELNELRSKVDDFLEASTDASGEGEHRKTA
jgi:ParB/RepB/Spo0J family partition protein